MGAEQRKKQICQKVGDEALNILKKSGIDVDKAINQILLEQQEQQNKNREELSKGLLENALTSELVYKSKDPRDDYAKEHLRRLSAIGFNQAKAEKIYEIEKIILSVDPENNKVPFRERHWVGRYFIFPESTPETMPEKEFMTLSELLIITDDANSAFFRDHKFIEGKAWDALCMAAITAKYTKGIYAIHFEERTEKLGWSREQTRAYTRNEFLLTERLKWNMHQNPAWTPQTCDLGLYKKNS